MSLAPAISIVMVACLLCALRAGAADSGTDVPSRTGLEPFHIYFPTFSIEMNYFYNSSTIKPINAPGSAGTTTPIKSHDSGLEELLKISTQGYLIDPNTFTIGLTGTFGAEELWQREQDARSSQILAIHDYDFVGTFFPKTDSPLTLHASRTTEFTSQPFSETYQTISNNYDATWTISSKNFDTTIRAFHDDLTQHSPGGSDNFRYSQNGAQIDSGGTLGVGQRISFDYQFHDVHETDALKQSSSFNVNSATLVYENDFGDHLQHNLTSTLSYLDQTGDFAQNRFRIDEDLLLHHNDRFETFYQYQLENTHYPQVDTILNRLQGGFRAKPFDNLHLTGTLGGLTQDQSGSQTDEFYAHLDVDYSHKAPLGVISSTLNLSLDRQYNQAQNAPAHVTTGASFDASQEIIVPHTGIQQNSVGVRDASGIRAFFLGLDYTTIYKNDRAIIQRIPGGAIPANSTILLDYIVSPQPANDVATDSLAAGMRYDFKESMVKGLSLYAHYFIQQQNINSDQPGAFIADNVNAFTYGAEYRIWRLMFSAEHEDHRSDLFPYSSSRFLARYEDRIGQDLRISADVAHARTRFDDNNTHFSATTFTGNLDYRLARDLFADVTVEHVRIGGDAAANSHGWDEELSLKYMRGDTTLKTAIRHSDLYTPTQDSSFLFLYFSAERRF